MSGALTELPASSETVLPDHGISFREATGVWARIAALSFGGPAGQIAVMHRILVDEKRWIGEERLLHALNYCMLLPDIGRAHVLTTVTNAQLVCSLLLEKQKPS